jgi:hypothetical protein
MGDPAAGFVAAGAAAFFAGAGAGFCAHSPATRTHITSNPYRVFISKMFLSLVNRIPQP